MISKDRGLFARGIGDKNMLLVSRIPKGMFRKEVDMILAGRVVGKEHTKLPLAGEVLVPHLKFVGAHVCQDRRCGGILFWKK